MVVIVKSKMSKSYKSDLLISFFFDIILKTEKQFKVYYKIRSDKSD